MSKYERLPLKNTISFTSSNGRSNIDTEIITNLPMEFCENATMSWKLTLFSGRKFDAILGQNILEFVKTMPYNEHEIHQLESLNINRNVLDNIYNDLNTEEKLSLDNILKTYEDLIFTEGQILDNTNIIEHEIRTITEKPIYTKMYRYPHIHEKEICDQISDMLRQGIITESNSPYNSPLWIVPKKVDNSGEKRWRIVIDYRKLNDITVDDKFPIPNIDNILDKLGRAQYFSTIDLAKGFH